MEIILTSFVGVLIFVGVLFAPIYISNELRLITGKTWGLRWDSLFYAAGMMLVAGGNDIAYMIAVFPGAYITTLLIVVSISIHSGIERYENVDIDI